MHMQGSRKDFLKSCVRVVPAMLGIGLAINGCVSKKSGESEEKTSGPTDSCNDLSGVSENDINTRKNFNYVEVSPLKNKTCSQCNLYIPPKPGSSCGNCMLFKGPVQPGGTCTYWAPKITEAG